VVQCLLRLQRSTAAKTNQTGRGFEDALITRPPDLWHGLRESPEIIDDELRFRR
jgi:hypothetical protein